MMQLQKYTVLVVVCVFCGVNAESGFPNVTTADDLLPSLLAMLGKAVPQFKRSPLIKHISRIPVTNLVEIVGALVDTFLPSQPIPHVDEDTWWGEKDAEIDESIRPYKVQFKEQSIKTLLSKLQNREDFTKPLNKAAFTYGIDSDFLKDVLDYWEFKYDFKERENRINEFPQYMTNVQGLDVHFYHIKPDPKFRKVVPLLMLHGWPLSNMEYLYLFPQLLTKKEGYDFVFEIIAPSIPGFGYSQGTSKIGLSPYQIGVIFKNLMSRLGFKKFYIHGGDTGQYIAADMMTLYQDDILGLHTNFPYSFRPKTLAKYLVGSLSPPAVVEPKYADRMYPIFSRIYFIVRYFGYFHMQASKPDALGPALQDSPSGLAAWILAAMSWASNPNHDYLYDGGLPKSFDLDDLLDALTIMWDAQAVTTSIRFYAETTAVFQDPKLLPILINPTKVPYSCIKFRYEIIYQPDSFIKDKYPNLVHSTTLDYGGHFAAFENPGVLADDLWLGVKKMMNYHKRQFDLAYPSWKS